MSKNNFKTLYFNHDSDACTDDKILQLRKKKGWEGYGIYWALVEAMARTKNGYLSRDTLNCLELRLATSKKNLLDVVNFCLDVNLFMEHPEYGIFSNRLLRDKNFWQLCLENGRKHQKRKKC